jgi:hypothetical protein
MENKDKKLKIFISYSHNDNLENNHLIDDFKNHMVTLENNGLIECWYDREIYNGEDFQKDIDNNLEDADIICLFLSANFLSSSSCIEEKNKALEFKKKKNISVIPIILSSCGWKDEKGISNLLALPPDGCPVSNYEIKDDAWHDIYNGLKRSIEKEISIKSLKINKDFFNKSLNNAEMLKKAHPNKVEVTLEDIFIYPELYEYDVEDNDRKKIDSASLFENILDYPKFILSGEDQSGKTTLCKFLFKRLRELNLIPIYVSDSKKYFDKKIKNKIIARFDTQYETEIRWKDIDKSRVVPIIDDFHYALNKQNHLEYLNKYSKCILISDDIYDISIENNELLSSFSNFRINELKPSLQNELIEKWISLTDKNESYELIDQKTELVNNFLGKNIGHGLIPIYPFFILSAIVAHDTFQGSLDSEITSQGYCYQALISFYLIKNGVKTSELDSYINFLTEIGFYFFNNQKSEMNKMEFEQFLIDYSDKYILPINEEDFVGNLDSIFIKNHFNNYSFNHRYIRYFFIAKYLADNMENQKEVESSIETIMQNLHVNENAYITIFGTVNLLGENVPISSVLECSFVRYVVF